MDVINKRRSIRKYTDQKISKEDIVKMLEAAMNAPTARNTQGWRFIVVQDKTLLEKISVAIPTAPFAKDANGAIIVYGDRDVVSREEFIFEDCGAAIQNILLEATSLGIGTCWCAIAPAEDRVKGIKELFDMKDNQLPVACIVMGYPDEVKEENYRYDEDKVTWML